MIRPTVLLPRDSGSWSLERLETALLHEFAHVRRRDGLSQAVALAACACLWFNPVVWLCAAAMRAEAERATDDAVLAAGVRPSSYAAELLKFAAEAGPGKEAIGPVGASIMSRSKIEPRIRAIVETRNCRRAATPAESLGVASIGVLTALLLASSHVSGSVAEARPDRPFSASAAERQPRHATAAVRPPDVIGRAGEGGESSEHDKSARRTDRAAMSWRRDRSGELTPSADVAWTGADARGPSGESMTRSGLADPTDGRRATSADVRQHTEPRQRSAGSRTRSADLRPDAEKPSPPAALSPDVARQDTRRSPS